MPTALEIKQDAAFVESQGQMVELLNKDRARVTFYTPAGKALPNLPADMYHRTLYRKKGFTLQPPTPVATPETLPKDAVVSSGAEGPSTVVVPPRHIHVMREDVGSPCLVQGCGAVRLKPPIKQSSAKKNARVKETSNA